MTPWHHDTWPSQELWLHSRTRTLKYNDDHSSSTFFGALVPASVFFHFLIFIVYFLSRHNQCNFSSSSSCTSFTIRVWLGTTSLLQIGYIDHLGTPRHLRASTASVRWRLCPWVIRNSTDWLNVRHTIDRPTYGCRPTLSSNQKSCRRQNRYLCECLWRTYKQGIDVNLLLEWRRHTFDLGSEVKIHIYIYIYNETR